jgi:hypothetical protein
MEALYTDHKYFVFQLHIYTQWDGTSAKEKLGSPTLAIIYMHMTW